MNRAAMIAWADDAYALGSQLATVTGLYGPQLEENLALGSFAQDHLGHARTLYLLVEPDDTAVNRLLFERDADAYRTSLLAGAWLPFDWLFVCVRGLCYALADRVRCSAVRARDEHADVARTIDRDTAVHVEHWREWLATSVESGQAERVATLLGEMAAMMGEFYSEREWPGESEAMLEAWCADVRGACFGTGVTLPELNVAALRSAAADLRSAGLAGRDGRHDVAFRALVAEASSVYRTHPGATLA